MPLFRVKVSAVLYVDAPNERDARKCALDNVGGIDHDFWDEDIDPARSRAQINRDGWCGSIPYQPGCGPFHNKKVEEFFDGKE